MTHRWVLNMRTRFYLGVFLSLTMLCLSFSRAFANGFADIVLVNQVRGVECCNAGTVENVQKQVELHSQYKIPATFMLRYDAITNPDFVEVFKKEYRTSIELGIFLEITPSLAKDAGVTYRAPEGQWYKAKYAYLLGYSVEERKKLIDTAFNAFIQTFGYSPSVTAGWMVDSTSLQYLVEKHHVISHEITREQWGIDSYTLYGGPVNVPYYPSKNWALIPASTLDQQLPLVIVRQTITDPLYTYGDLTSVYTSQPNDYMMKDFSTRYFKDLILGVENQLPSGFGVVGLENSMEHKHYEEFERQLAFLHDEESRKTVETHALKEYVTAYTTQQKENTVSVYSRNEDQKTAYWINAPTYRMRVMVNGSFVMVTDYRIYSDNLKDPYQIDPVSSPNAYWIAPFVLDGSRYRQREGKIYEGFLDAIKSSLPFQKSHEGDPVLNDFSSLPTGILLPSKNRVSMRVGYTDGSAFLSYNDKEGKEVFMEFSKDSWKIVNNGKESIVLEADSKELNEIQSNPNLHWIDVQSPTLFEAKPTITVDENADMRDQLSKQLLPEAIQTRVSMENTTVLYDATHVILGRNPARIVVYLRDEKGNSTVSQEEMRVTKKDGEFFYTKVGQPESSLGQYIIDMTELTRGKYTPVLHIDGETMELNSVRFITNCKEDFKGCISHPQDIFFYIYAKVQDIFHRR